MALNLDLYFASARAIEQCQGSSACLVNAYSDMGPRFFKIFSERSAIFTVYNAKHWVEEQLLPNLHVDDFKNNSLFY